MEVLKTKGSAHTDLTGYRQVERIYPNQTITDYFRVVRKIKSDEDREGNCYDWYEIDRHYRTVDKSGPVAEQVEQIAAELEDALCEQDASADERMGAMEDAICELDTLISTIKEGGTEV